MEQLHAGTRSTRRSSIKIAKNMSCRAPCIIEPAVLKRRLRAPPTRHTPPQRDHPFQALSRHAGRPDTGVHHMRRAPV
eukprot:3255383-Prymnesium_polylepis.1